MRKLLKLITLSSLFASCNPKMVTSLESSRYDDKKDITNYSVFPYGSIGLKGKWEKRKYVSSSRQQYFIDKDITFVTVAIGPGDKFEFSKPDLKGFGFVKAYFDWESKYHLSTTQDKISLLVIDSTNNYLIWKMYDDSSSTLMLNGAHPCACRAVAFQNITISTDKWDDSTKVHFLQEAFLGRR